MKIAGIVIIALIGLYILGGLLFKRRLFISKKIMLVTVLGVGLIVASNMFFSDADSIAEALPVYIQKAPEVEKAPYAIQTTSRLYYTSNYQDDGSILTINEYYYYDSKKWEFSKLPLQIDRDSYGEIKIYKR